MGQTITPAFNEYLSTRGIQYYNLYKLDNKDNKDNKLPEGNKDNALGSLEATSPDGEDIPLREHPSADIISSGVVISEAESVLNSDMIDRAVIQLFDNGEQAVQRYKLKVRINLHEDKENVEFIATLTKNWENFKKYIPADCRDEIIEQVKADRQVVKDKFDIKPYIGKFHLNQGRASVRSFTQVESFTSAIVWYDSSASIWRGMIRIHDWEYLFTLPNEYITEKQVKTGVKGQDVFTNPKWDKRERPKTWAQLRAEKKLQNDKN